MWLGVVALLVSSAFGQQKPLLLETENFFDLETITNPAISPDGAQIVFSRGFVDKLKDQSRASLWIIDRSSRRLRELTSGPWRDTNPVWSPDGKRIAFLSTRDGTPQIHALWADTREVAQLTHSEQAPSEFTWSPDSKTIAFTARIADTKEALPIKMPAKPKGAEWARPAIVIDRLNWRSDGVGPLEKSYSHIFLVDAIVGGTAIKLTDGDYNHSTPEWSSDGRTVYFSAIRKPDAEYLRGDSEIHAIDVKSRDMRTLTSRKGPDRAPRVSPNGKWIAYSGYDDQKLTNHVGSVYIMDAKGESKRVMSGDLASTPASIDWAADSSGLYYTMNKHGVTHLWFAPVEGKARQLTEGNYVLGSVSVANNGQAAGVRASFHDPGSLVSFDVKRPGAMEQLVDVNADVLAGRKLGEVEEIWATSKDGLKVQGWLVKPAQYEAGKKYPLVLNIHGGPWAAYTVGFSWSWQHFAAKGYGVLYMNPRGSTGYGQEFVSGIQYSYPGKDYDDLMASVDAAIAKGWVDDRNLFVWGGSGGGVLTAWIVGHTDRFRAAVSSRPVINWHSFVGTTDGASWYDQFRKFPWEDPMEYAVRSPLHYVGNVKTPTMVITGEADLRTPISQSEEYYRALKVLKKETLLIRVPEEFHGFRRPSHNLAHQLYLLAWFEKYRVKDGKAPATGE